MKNPCIDENFVYIGQASATLADKTYIIDKPAETWDPHPTNDWTITTAPVTHTLCGDILLTPKYESNDLSADGTPITYNSATGDFTVQSDRADLIDTTKKYQLVATLNDWAPSDYPNYDVTTVTREGDISFENPCDAPFTLTVPTQDAAGNRLTDNFSDEKIKFTLLPFTITPSRCSLSYSCASIVQTGESTSSIDCAAFTKDLVFDAETSDGVMELDSAPSTYGAPYEPGTYTVTLVGTVVGST